MFTNILLLVLPFCFFMLIRLILINHFKISYYEAKLKNRNIDISSIENITLIGIHRL